MFAVPGWSLTADSLKAETPAPASGAGSAKSRKRKRPNGGREEEAVTAENVAALYDSVVGGVKGETGKKAAQDAGKRRRKDSDGKRDKNKDDTTQSAEGDDQAETIKKSKSKSKSKKNNKEEAHKQWKPTTEQSGPAEAPTTTQSAPVPKPGPALTPLQASMRDKLISARFRHLNETLYTRPSEESFGLFRENPEMFDEYHQGFRRQVKVWPENPVDSFLEDIRTRAAVRTPHRSERAFEQQQQQPPQSLSRTPLPRTAGTCVIADLGCGDARLAASLQGDEASRARVDVRSFDLQSASPLVTAADIADLPLADGSVNVAVLCLALMGTNWLDFVEEAYRVLHWKGELWVAEIKSRFGPVRGKHAPVAHSVGGRRKDAAAAADAQARHEQDLAVEVDGLDDTRRETDVAAFVEALRKRGFVLLGQRAEAVDLSNRMFVKMHFVKAAAPVVGKGVKEQDRPAAAPLKKKKKMFQFERGGDGEDRAAEAAILKPCVYKIR